MSVDGSLMETGSTVVPREPHIREGSAQYDKLPPPEKALFQLEKLRVHLDLAGGRVTLDNETGNNNGTVKGPLGMGGYDWTLTPSIVSPEGTSSEVSLITRPSGSNERKVNAVDKKFDVVSEHNGDRFVPSRVLRTQKGISTISSDGSVPEIAQIVAKIVGTIQPHG